MKHLDRLLNVILGLASSALSLAHAETVSHSDPVLANSTGVIQATCSANNVVSITMGKGELVACDANGFILKTEDGHYLDRITWFQTSEEDIKTLLRTPRMYQSLSTLFNRQSVSPGRGCYARSPLEKVMQNLWCQGKTLPARIVTRYVVLDLLRNYHFGCIEAAVLNANAQTQAQAAQGAAGYVGNLQRTSAAGYAAYQKYCGDSADAVNRRIQDVVSPEEAFDRAYQGYAASLQIPGAEQEAEYQWRMAYQLRASAYQASAKAASLLQALNHYGFNLNRNGPYMLIPQLDLSADIDAELNP